MEMTTTADTARIVPEGERNMDDKKSKIAIFCVVACILVSVVAIILAIIGIANSGGNQYYIGGSSPNESSTSSDDKNLEGSTSSDDKNLEGSTSSDDKIWLIMVGHYAGRYQYLDEESGVIKGYDVDLANAVCRYANKNCRLVWDLYERCWNSEVGKRPHPAQGLMGGWYDACLGWINTRDRARSYLFSDSFARPIEVSLWKAKNNNFTWPDFAGRRVGFLDGWYADEHCLPRYEEIRDFDPTDAQQVFHFIDEAALRAAIEAEEVDVGFVSEIFFEEEHPLIEAAITFDENQCLNGGLALMMPKDLTGLADWFNAGLKGIKNTNEYKAICDNIDNTHSHQPGEPSVEVCV